MTFTHHVGQRVSYDGALCTVRFMGEVAGTSGTWLGVEWDDSTRGKHDGCHKGTRYFTCKSKLPTAASFVRPSRPADPPRNFLAAVNHKYASEYTLPDGRRAAEEIIFFGKRAEEVGFEKIRRKQANIGELTIVILEDLQVANAREDGEAEGTIASTCPKITQLDLSRNLFGRLDPVFDICRELPHLQHLTLNGNRFQNILDDQSSDSIKKVKELSLEETLMTWEEVCHIATKCPSLAALDAGSNQFSSLPSISYGNLSSTLTSINLEINEFTSFVDFSTLTALTSLRNIHLKGNNISAIAPEGTEGPIFSETVQYLDVSYNNIQSWTFVDQLPKHFPGLVGLRIGHNPFYDAADDDAKATSSEESHMFVVARLASLKSLNFSQVTPADRTNAEMFYLSRIGKQLATVSEDTEQEVLDHHPRYADLCEIYGKPNVVRKTEANPAYLEARLVTVGFHLQDGEVKTAKIPSSFDIYAVKGVAGRLFNLPPLKLRLIWETGEWDPVAGFDDQEGDSSDEEDAEEERERQSLDTQAAEEDGAGDNHSWVIQHHITSTIMTLKPQFFLVRPGAEQITATGQIRVQPATAVPLIPMDLLPKWVEVVGVPRSLSPDDTRNMGNLGIVHQELGTFGLRFAPITQDKTCDIDDTEEPNVMQSHAVFSSNAFEKHKPTTSSSGLPPTPVPKPKIKLAQGLSYSRHNPDNQHQLAQAEQKPAVHREVAKLPTNITSPTPSPTPSPCRHWCHHGVCRWGTNCHYEHTMPTTPTGLEGVGLVGFPDWWLQSRGLMPMSPELLRASDASSVRRSPTSRRMMSQLKKKQRDKVRVGRGDVQLGNYDEASEAEDEYEEEKKIEHDPKGKGEGTLIEFD
ncbi:PAC2-like protein [Fusarium heterosporum]|uniref:PAC2-like protein n=1 Tax=Fusarium heterosporum TaxID=42747 RepID=A0A8H5WN97_FUSHE|nr:PAC2-like protein [Fusarium heterosporum]